MGFAIAELQDHDDEDSYEEESNASASTRTGSAPAKKQKLAHRPETEYPQSLSITAILKAGQLVKPKERRRVTFAIEAFDVKKRGVVKLGVIRNFGRDTEVLFRRIQRCI